jgi:hypothetical protein
MKSGQNLRSFRQEKETTNKLSLLTNSKLFLLMGFRFFLVTVMVFFAQIPEGLGQIGMMVGTNYSNIRHENRFEKTQGQMSLHLGVNVEVVPLKTIPNFSIRTDLILIQKGYTVKLDGSKYRVNLEYGSFAPMIKYAFDEDFAIHSGIEFNGFTGSNVGEDGTFRKNEKALFFGFDILSSRRLSFYSRASFGQTPVLDYYDIDPIEGIQGRISDLYTTTIMLGLQLNIHHEKIRF